jgi:hypothetical protein
MLNRKLVTNREELIRYHLKCKGTIQLRNKGIPRIVSRRIRSMDLTILSYTPFLRDAALEVGHILV